MSTSTTVVNGSMIYILAICGLLFILILFFMVYYAIRYRSSRNPVPVEIRGSPLIEIVWIVVPTLLVMTMFLYGLTGFDFLRKAPKDSIPVTVHARQWSWLFEYANRKFSPDLVVPLGKNIRCNLVSSDVIHGFYIPSFRVQQDAVPGMKTMVWFNATTLGTYYILCSQYCGLKHSGMLAKLIVVPQDLFDKWLKGAKITFNTGADLLRMPPGEALLFERGCVSCHSIEGGTMVGPTFKGLFGSLVRVKTDGKIRTVAVDSGYIRESILQPGADVVDGFPNTMPSARDVLTDAEIAEITAYIKSLK